MEGSGFIVKIPPVLQYPVLPTGCEVTALSMLLQWILETDVPKEELARELIKEPNPFKYKSPDGKEVLCGGNPHRAFIGDPFDDKSFGVFHGPIFQLLQQKVPSTATITDLTGCPFEHLLQQMKANNCPAIVWCTLELKEEKITDEWIDFKVFTETQQKQLVQWKSPEHCVLMVGYNNDVIYVNDPHTGKLESYNKSIFQKRWEALGNQAIIAYKT